MFKQGFLKWLKHIIKELPLSKTLTKLQCLICESEDVNLLTSKVRFDNKADVYKCSQCNLTFLNQQSFHFPDDFYEKNYHQTYITHIEPDALNPEVYFEKMKKSTKIWADKFREMLKGDETVLDVGCSTGHFIELVKDKTSEIYGHELSKNEIQFCKDKLNLDVSDQPLEERFKDKKFDYITMIFVLEHIADPIKFLNDLKKFLKPDGKFVILVPNIQDALVNFYDIPEFRSFYYCIEHLFYFEPNTIKKLFDIVGLKGAVDVIQEYPITNHINWAYTRGPSDVLASRRGVPNVELTDAVPLEKWEKLWSEFNVMYHDFLKSNGFGDRVWSVVG